MKDASGGGREFLPGESIHTDHQGPYAFDRGGCRYSQIFFDVASAKVWVRHMREKTAPLKLWQMPESVQVGPVGTLGLTAMVFLGGPIFKRWWLTRGSFTNDQRRGIITSQLLSTENVERS